MTGIKRTIVTPLYLAVLLLYISVSAGFGQAIKADGSRGTVVSGGPLSFGITAGTQVGGNLFHSFQNFSVPTSGSATFSGPASVQNIISRVTGVGPSYVSNIDGLLASTINGANMYFFNPNGVAFGPNASLSITGSFHVSTADYIKLGATGRFDASNPAADVLTSDPPSAFGFLSARPAPISFAGDTTSAWSTTVLTVPTGKMVSIVGGDINMTRNWIGAPGGQVNLISVGSPGEVTIGTGPPLMNGFGNLGTIELSRSYVSTRETTGGDVYIRGGQFILTGGSIVTNSSGAGPGGILNIATTGPITVNGGTFVSIAEGVGNGGSITVNASSISLSHALIESDTLYSGSGGAITLNAADYIALSGSSGINAVGRGSGNAGTIDIKSKNVIVNDLSYVSTNTSSIGSGGDITIASSESVIISGFSVTGAVSGIYAMANGAGKGGNITVDTPYLAASNGGLIAAGVGPTGSGNGGSVNLNVGTLALASGGEISGITRGTGNGGIININASGPVIVSGWIMNPDHYPTGIFSNTRGSGNAGTIFLNAGSLTIASQAQIASTSRGTGAGGTVNVNISGPVNISEGSFDWPSGIFSSAWSSGHAGTVNLNVGNLTLTSGGQLASSTRGTGAGGTVVVNASGLVSISEGREDNPTGIFSMAWNSGNAGIVDLNAGSLALTSGGQLSGSTRGTGTGGSINVNASGPVTISGTNVGWPSGIFSNTYSSGNAGSINVNASDLYMSGGSSIGTRSTGTGTGGNITIKVPGTIQMTDSSITAATVSTDGGNISIDPWLLRLTNSSITASVGGIGNGGNINIVADNVILENASNIIANAEYGDGGHINIVSNAFLTSPDSFVSASSSFGLSGTVGISAPYVDVSATMVDLPDTFLNIASLMPKSCAENEEEMSTFVMKGRDGLPPQPGGLLASPIY